MSLESLVDEIRSRGEVELKAVAERRATELAKIGSELEARLAAVRAEGARATEAEVARDRAQRLAAAHIAARRLAFEAREERLNRGLAEAHELLAKLSGTADYPKILGRMIAAATSRLGRSVRISGRSEDAAVLSRLAGGSFDPTPRAIVGGIVAESNDGHRRLDLSFDGLLRQRSDVVRALLA
jgi:vacuolar-type H+-ATPase subunit E/Vma4